MSSPKIQQKPANKARGEASIFGLKLRPSFSALVAAEEEIGSLFGVVARAAEGKIKLHEMTALFWHCLEDTTGLAREEFAEKVLELGLAAATPLLRTLLQQILRGR